MIGENIKQRRLELGMTQDELAKKMGYKPAAPMPTERTKKQRKTRKNTVKTEFFSPCGAFLCSLYEHIWTVKSTCKRNLLAHLLAQMLARSQN